MILQNARLAVTWVSTSGNADQIMTSTVIEDIPHIDGDSCANGQKGQYTIHLA